MVVVHFLQEEINSELLKDVERVLGNKDNALTWLWDLRETFYSNYPELSSYQTQDYTIHPLFNVLETAAAAPALAVSKRCSMHPWSRFHLGRRMSLISWICYFNFRQNAVYIVYVTILPNGFIFLTCLTHNHAWKTYILCHLTVQIIYLYLFHSIGYIHLYKFDIPIYFHKERGKRTTRLFVMVILSVF